MYIRSNLLRRRCTEKRSVMTFPSLQNLAIDVLLQGDIREMILRLPEVQVDLTTNRLFDIMRKLPVPEHQETVERFRLRVMRGDLISDGEWGTFKFFLRSNTRSTPPYECDCEAYGSGFVEWMVGRHGLIVRPPDAYQYACLSNSRVTSV